MENHIDDVALVVALRGGDEHALAGMYDRYAEQLYNFAYGLLRNGDDAADVVHDAFLLARERIDQLRDATKLRAWLFAIVRNAAMRRSKDRSRSQASDEVDDMTIDTPNLGRGLEAAELQQLVWTAADGLDERDRQLLELTLKQNIEGEELAEIMGVKTATVYVLVNRMKDRVERSLGALLVARLGRDECEELRVVLDDWDGTFSVLWRKRVARHVDDCEICERTKAGVASPAALLSAMPLVALPTGLRERVLGSAASGATVDPGDIAFTASHGFPEVATAGRRTPFWLLGAAAAVAAVVLGAFALFGGGDGDSDVVESIGVEIGDAAVLVASTSTPGSTSSTSAQPDELDADPSSSSMPSSTSTPGVAGPGGGAGDEPSTPQAALVAPDDAPTAPAPSTTLGAAAETPATTQEPTVNTSTTTLPPPTTTVAPTTTLAPSAIEIDGARIDLGSRRSGAITIRNTGGVATDWSASSNANVLSVSPNGGVLQPGSSATLTVQVDRARLAESGYEATVTVKGDANVAAATVTWVVSQPPEIHRATTSASSVFTRVGVNGPCTLPTTLTVTVETTDETGVTSVQARWINDDSGASGTVALLAGRAADSWSAQLGPFDDQGGHSVTVTATDRFGASSQETLNTAFLVLPC